MEECSTKEEKKISILVDFGGCTYTLENVTERNIRSSTGMVVQLGMSL